MILRDAKTGEPVFSMSSDSGAIPKINGAEHHEEPMWFTAGPQSQLQMWRLLARKELVLDYGDGEAKRNERGKEKRA